MGFGKPGQDLSSQSDILKCQWLVFFFFPPQSVHLVQTSLGAKQKEPLACVSGEMKPLGCEEGLGYVWERSRR